MESDPKVIPLWVILNRRLHCSHCGKNILYNSAIDINNSFERRIAVFSFPDHALKL